MVRAGRTLVISEVTVSAVVDERLVRVAMMLQTNCRVKMSQETSRPADRTFCEVLVSLS